MMALWYGARPGAQRRVTRDRGRPGRCRWLLMHTNIGLAWLFNMVFSLLLVGVATWTVVEVAPQAAGAGVAEVTAYLNGCLLPKVPSQAFPPKTWSRPKNMGRNAYVSIALPFGPIAVFILGIFTLTHKNIACPIEVPVLKCLRYNSTFSFYLTSWFCLMLVFG